MRPVSLLSAALCGVLWISLNVNSVVAQKEGPSTSCGNHCSATLSTATSDAGFTLTTTSTPVFQTLALQSPTSTSASTPTTSIVIEFSNISSSKGDSTTQQTSPKASSGKSNTAPIVGGVVGGTVILALILGAAFFFWRRRRRAAAGTEDFGVLEKHRASSPSVYPAAGISTYDTSSPAPQLSPVPAITSVESHHLMDGYPESGLPRSAEIAPVVGAAKPYATNTQNEVDDDGVSLRCPSPVHEGVSPAGERDSVPRLPIYNRGAGDTPDRGPAL